MDGKVAEEPTTKKSPTSRPLESDGERKAGAGECVDENDGASRDGSSSSLLRRYSIRDDEEGRFLTCVEAPNVAVRIERGLSVTAATAKRAPEGTIYLDGAAACEPFMDVQRRVYNLDHHEGCVRPFTLATCEQAMVLVTKGLDLRAGEWTVWANEPDLDTVLAIWVLLNHMRLAEEGSEVRRAVMPLLRLEGAIDANGLRYVDLCGFPGELVQRTSEVIDELRVRELEEKSSGRWGSIDFLEYTADMLCEIDTRYYSPCLFEETPAIDELQRVKISDRRMAVICRADTGIYEVEKGLATLHGNNVGLILLQKNARTYTIRQVDPFLPTSLDALYERLNFVDPAVDAGGPANRWGGSAEIGGSPRETGTALAPSEIARVCRWVYQPPTRLQRIGASVGVSAGAVMAVSLALLAALFATESASSLELGALARAAGTAAFSGAVAALAGLLLLIFGFRHRRQLGIRMPAGWKWIVGLPSAALAGVLGGAWIVPGARAEPGMTPVVMALLLPLAAEVLGRGVVLGTLTNYFNVQRTNGPWFLSRPTLISTLLTATLSGLFLPTALAAPGAPGYWATVTWVLGALALGLGCGVARERSRSLLPPILIHLLAAFWALYLPGLW